MLELLKVSGRGGGGRWCGTQGAQIAKGIHREVSTRLRRLQGRDNTLTEQEKGSKRSSMIRYTAGAPSSQKSPPPLTCVTAAWPTDWPSPTFTFMAPLAGGN